MSSNFNPTEKEIRRIAEFYGISMDRDLTLEQIQNIKETVWAEQRLKDAKRLEELRKPKEASALVDGILEGATQVKESPIEEILFLALNTKSMTIGLGKTQYPVGPYFIDIAFPAVKLAVKCDGRAYHSEPAQIARDQKRTKYLSRLGWTVIRFWGSEIRKNLYGCVDQVMRVHEKLSEKFHEKEGWEVGA